MLRFTFIFSAMVVMIACNNPGKNKTETKDTTTNTANTIKEIGCPEDPDTLLSAMNLRDNSSVQAMIPDDSKPDSLSGQYHFYSAAPTSEILTLTQHPGDGQFNISIFNVKYADKADRGYILLEPKNFVSGKGIQLGMNKQEIIDKLGTCYTAKDSADGYIELYYRIESPKDTKNGFLFRNNMPIYYASYKLWKNKLGEFEFGFEYP